LRHGVHDNGSDALAADVETLAEILERNGYTTAAFVGAFVLDRQFGLAQGFQHYDDDMTGGRQADQFCYAERNARLVTDAALAWLSTQRDKPQFVWIHYFDPHSPYQAPDYDPAFSSLSDYDAEICFADSQLKRVVDFFDVENGRPTLFVVAADHGEGLGDHGEPTHGMFAYNTTLHVPLVVRLPDHAYRGTRVSMPVSLIDVAPAVLNWLNLPLPADVDGRPLPLADGSSQAQQSEPRGIYFENYFVANNYGWSPLIGAIWNDLKFIQAPQPEFYDLVNDPSETTQLYHERGQEAKQHESRFKSLVADLRARGSFAAQAVELTTSDFSTLESLGYAGGSHDGNAAEGNEEANAPDPKEMVEVLAKLHAATIAMEQKRHRAAVDLLIQVACSDDVANPRAVRMLSALIVDAPQERPRIVACLQQAHKLAGRKFDVHSLVMLGIGLVAERQHEAAIEILQEVTRRAPAYPDAFRYLGDAHSELQQFSEAKLNYQRAIELTTDRNERPEWFEHVTEQLDKISHESNESN
jgi:arylsulfatase A-like enzyme